MDNDDEDDIFQQLSKLLILSKDDLEAISNMNTQVWATVAQPLHTRKSISRGLSPTDMYARGHYPYQEPEQDEQGTLYGYKVLVLERSDRYGRFEFRSPSFPARWSPSGKLQADEEPSGRSMNGIHCTKRPDHPELEKYFTTSGKALLVKCALYGTVIETEQGFRAQYAQIIGVFDYGNWFSYQDYQERAAAYSRRIAEEEIGWKWRGGRGPVTTNPYYTSDADS
jgi:hypothetical protein